MHFPPWRYLVYVLGASVLLASVFGASTRLFVVGEVHCTGTETELLECSHNSIGHHFCGEDADYVAIECGMQATNTHIQQHCCWQLLIADNIIVLISAL